MKKIILIIFLITTLNNCGFKIAENKELKGYLISEVNTYGEGRINYQIKNLLSNKSKNNSEKKLKITLNTNKEKKIKEKNINNEITKYQMNVTTKVNFEDVSQKLIDNFTINVSGEYRILENHIQTINNEKKLQKNLADEIADKIIEELSDKLNDL
jgi:outer membrane lipopolysaccharide assembly protein LptE/RlpB